LQIKYIKKDKQNGNKRRIYTENGQFLGQIARCKKQSKDMYEFEETFEKEINSFDDDEPKKKVIGNDKEMENMKCTDVCKGFIEK
jgi:hypothetical protein